jgi:hypothetical protein
MTLHVTIEKAWLSNRINQFLLKGGKFGFQWREMSFSFIVVYLAAWYAAAG